MTNANPHTNWAHNRLQQGHSTSPAFQGAPVQPNCCIVEEPDDELQPTGTYHGVQDRYNTTCRERLPKRGRPDCMQYEVHQGAAAVEPSSHTAVHMEEFGEGPQHLSSARRSQMAIQETVCTRTLKGPNGTPTAIIQETVTVTQVHKRLRSSAPQGAGKSDRSAVQ
jgi:hypothetical protein